MQAITMAIGKQGIEYFSRQFVSNSAETTLSRLNPPDKKIKVPDFEDNDAVVDRKFTQFEIALSSGQLHNFTPEFLNVEQKSDEHSKGNLFVFSLQAQDFTAQYDWHENYHLRRCSLTTGDKPIYVCKDSDQQHDFTYKPDFEELSVHLPASFEYKKETNTYEVRVENDVQPKSSIKNPNIPSGSGITREKADACFGSQASKATTQAVSQVDFKDPIQALFEDALTSIPASGDLGNDITFDFAVGSSGIGFPLKSGSETEYEGITIGATGVASFKGQQYSESPGPDLPIPAVPVDDKHMNIYVADWAVNGLNWAYFSAGLLDLSLTPADMPNPEVLRTTRYAAIDPAFGQYGSRSMIADIRPNAAPVNRFQTVYIFNKDAFAALQGQVPKAVYDNLKQGFEGRAYSDEAALLEILKTSGIEAVHFDAIEAATRQPGMTTTQSITFKLLIDLGQAENPYVSFTVERVDVMTNLQLGLSGNKTAQTMQFGFINVSNKATFLETTITGLNREDFGFLTWGLVGEASYAEVMSAMGKTGVAIPIMQGFQFLFSDAELTIEQGFISIATQIEMKPEKLPASIAHLVLAPEVLKVYQPNHEALVG